MKWYLILTVAIIQLVLNTESKHWALVVAGSSGWYNYRHQADACHAYQILHKHGIPDENIVVMMYDDIAENVQNPTKGKIINQPNGPDVYHGVPKDYTGETVTPENFLNILQGKKDALKGTGSGKVIESGPDDNVFVYFTDHGAPDIIAFPDDELHAEDLQKAILSMHENKQYKKMVFYVEACESGSMFNRHKLPSNVNVFATTAANGEESSYACYYDRERNTYLGDVYSVMWLQNSDKADFNVETLEQQFEKVKEETNTSHVMEFGDLTMGSLTIGNFQGDSSKNYINNETKITEDIPITDAVPAPDVKMWILHHQLRDFDLPLKRRREVLKELYEEKEMRLHIRSTFQTIVKSLVDSREKQKEIISKPAAPVKRHCYKQSVTKFRRGCGNLGMHEHTLRHLYVLANLCDEGYSTERIVETIHNVCMMSKSEKSIVY